MGSPLSPIIADIVMQELENTVLSAVSKISQFPYIIDLLMTCDGCPCEKRQILDAFNKFSPRLQFTLELIKTIITRLIRIDI